MFKHWFGRLGSVAALPALLLCGAAQAQGVSAADARAVRTMVEAQLKALADAQGDKAFSYASPAIRQQFGEAEVFMAMVRQRYAMLIRPTAISYFRAEGGDGVATQDVQFRDAQGRLWRAVYELERQPDKRWRIGGCIVVPCDEGSIS